MKHLALCLSASLPLLCFGCAQSQKLYLSCAMSDQTGARHDYTFEVDERRKTLFWVEGTQDFEVQRLTDTQIWGSHDQQFGPDPYDLASFHLNRVTGEGTIAFFREPTPEEKRECESERGWGCDDHIMIEGLEHVGACRVVSRQIE